MPRLRSRQPANNGVEFLAKSDALIRLWVLRALVSLGGNRMFIQAQGFSDDALAKFLGLDEWLSVDPFERSPDFKPAIVLASLRARHEAEESKAGLVCVPPVLASNVATIGDMLNLSQVERRLLEFAVLLHSEPVLAEACEQLGGMSTLRLRRALQVLLNVDEAELKEALSPRSTLQATGLVQVDRNSTYCIQNKLDLLSSAFADGMLSDVMDPVSVLRGTLSSCSPAQLGFEDYPHVARDLKVLIPYLRLAVSERKRGVNILIHGAPGTGKSQLARVIAQDMQRELYEVSSEDADGNPIDAQHRLRAHRAAQAILAQRGTLLLFDEVEDVFADGNSFFGQKSTAQLHKAWINRILEENPVPCLWLSNNVSCMDPAFLRRFDLVIELEVPPLRQRRRIVEQVAADLLPAENIERVATSEHLTPAIISRAAQVVRSIQHELAPGDVPKALERLISTTLKAQGHPELRAQDANRLPDYYDPAYINSSEDLQQISEGIKSSGSARVCLYGPPGTGKTAFGRWLADELQRPLSVKRASDIMSMWLGGSEKNLARAFREAEDEGALLLIDEVDSFLQDRRQAQRSWEVSGVNEMLTQMEAFSGVFIASTNLVDGLDQAALRRFDLKLKFDYLRSEQAWQLLLQQCRAFGLQAPAEALRNVLARLDTLTPGDFAVVARQHLFRPFRDSEQILRALQDECGLKQQGKAVGIGFV